ncbi:hypothetical protein [Streptomyces sp. SID12501]|uniref:Low molecular weight antigen MTB12-like C-terminal domain-containing protein n=1 Tax=Streptomyces sp. SID12501 TaxID=2706042 RepID=A0A6B3BUF9_9ACTN|nr:hypothetical protein [Streptomyces sp. SID12501]NEC88021.1 hypothetical protein [Streptomyces sp. SID12501]
MPATTRRAALAVVAAVVLVLASSCDGGDKSAPETSRLPAASSSGTAPADTSPSPTVSEPSSPVPTGTAREDPAQSEEEIREAWQTLFEPASSSGDRSEVVESGDQNELMIINLFDDPLGGKLRAEVTSVSYTSDLNADVAYTLTREGRQLDTRGPGASVLQDGTWKVALRTVCDLTRHAKDAPKAPACDEPALLAP